MRSSVVKKFRWDIQGLRAFAVLAVVIFHILPHQMPGGYLGVDVFFVISGYLIIGMVCKEIRNDNFLLSSFYIKRLKRLFPALFVTIIVTSLLAILFLLPEEIENFAESAIATVLYISNFYFYFQSDYFAENLKYAPLLHTWSLSVEEQFYIVFPVILIAIFKFWPKKLTLLLIIIALVSFLLSVYLVNTDRSLSFFISPTRFWQFIVGGLLAIHLKKIKINTFASNLIGFIGIGILTACLFIYNERTLFPGINAIIPTIATLCILSAGNQSCLFKNLMSLKINRFFGNISYSLYLWHWPVIVFFDLSINKDFQPFAEALIILLISILLGYFSWKYVEIPFKSMGTQHKNTEAICSAIFASSLIIGVSIFLLDGLPSRFSEEQLRYSSYINYDKSGIRGGRCFIYDDVNSSILPECIQYDEQKENILLVGDSHAAHWYSSLQESIDSDTQTVTQVTASGCRPIIPITGEKRCVDIIGAAFTDLIVEFNFDKIILVGRWKEQEVERILSTSKYLSEYAAKISVVGRTIEYYRSLPRLLATTEISEIKNDKHSRYTVLKKLDDQLKQLDWPKGIRYISSLDHVCPTEYSQCKVLTNSGVPMAFDYGHLTHEGAMELLKSPNFILTKD